MMWATKDEADSNKPKGVTKAHKPYQVSKAGAVTGWIWARGYDNALALAAKAEGFSVSTGHAPTGCCDKRGDPCEASHIFGR